MKQTVKKYKSHIAALAVIVLVLAVPMGAAAMADGMNDMIGGGSKQLQTFDTPSEFNTKSQLTKGVYNPALVSSAMSYHTTASSVETTDKQVLFSAETLGKEYNEIVVSYPDPTMKAGSTSSLWFGVDCSPNKIISSGAESMVLSLSASSDKVLTTRTDAYQEASQYPNSVQFYGVDGANVITVRIPVVITVTNATAGYQDTGFIYNITSEMQDYTITWAQSDILKAQVYLSKCSVVSMGIGLGSTLDTGAGAILDGDNIKFKLTLLGAYVNGYSVANIFMGLTGCCLLVGAVFATPFVNMADVKKKMPKRRR